MARGVRVVVFVLGPEHHVAPVALGAAREALELLVVARGQEYHRAQHARRDVERIDEPRRLELGLALILETTRLVEALDVTPRVLRSVVFLAAGDYEQLERFARCAERDWRDVVFWAVYEEHDAEQPRRVRSMDDPLR